MTFILLYFWKWHLQEKYFHKRVIQVHERFALPSTTVFHSFTECGSTFSFYNKTKAVIRSNHWMCYQYMDVVTTAFQQLSWLPERETVAVQMNTIEQFVSNKDSRQELQETFSQLHGIGN